MSRPTIVALALLAGGCSSDDHHTAQTAASDAAPPPGVPLELTVGALSAGGSLTLDVTMADPGEDIRILRSSAGMGAGACPGLLGGMCLDVVPPHPIMGPFPADALGEVHLTPTVPASVPAGLHVCFQAIAIRGAGGVDSVKSEVSCRVVDGGPVAIADGVNITDDYAGGWTSTGGHTTAFRHDATADVTVAYLEIFTGDVATPMRLTLHANDPATDTPGAVLGGTGWTSTIQEEWQGGPLAAPVTLVAGETYWFNWWKLAAAQSSRQSGGDSVTYLWSSTGAAPWNGPFTFTDKYRMCGGGGCPDF